MRSDTRTITIDARPEDVFAIVAEPSALPRWAIGFAKSMALTDDAWTVELAGGTGVPIRYVTSREHGVVRPGRVERAGPCEFRESSGPRKTAARSSA